MIGLFEASLLNAASDAVRRRSLSATALLVGVVALWVAFFLNTGTVGLVVALGANVVAVVWLARITTVLRNTPTARIRSVAAGLAEVTGRADRLPGEPALASPVTGLPCLWFCVDTFEVDGNGRRRFTGTQRSDSTFTLTEGDHWLVIDPDGAEVRVKREQTFQSPGRVQKERVILESDPLTVVGLCRPLSGEGKLADDARRIKMMQRPDGLAAPFLISDDSPEQTQQQMGWLITAHGLMMCALTAGLLGGLGS